MGPSSALDRVSPPGQPTSDAAAGFVQQLEAQLPGLQQELLSEARAPVGAQPSSRSKRLDALASRVRDLAAHALSHDLGIVAEELGLCQAIVDSASVLGVFDDADGDQLEESMQRIASSLASEAQRERTPTSGPVAPILQSISAGAAAEPTTREGKATIEAGWALQVAPTVLLVAPEDIAQGLREHGNDPGGADGPRAGEAALEIESIDDALRAPELARALAPDVVVIDIDLQGVGPLVEALLEGPLTATVPIIALGSWERPEQAATWVAQGVTRTLAKPVSPASLRKACLEVAANPTAPAFQPIGETTLDQLGARLAEELQHGLCHAADDETRSLSIDVGQGTEVMAALWGAISRIRELVAASSKGRVKFVPIGPEGALPAASWLTSGGLRPKGERPASAHEARRVTEHALVGRTIVVAEDDLSVNWFLSGVLRQAGARVLEARDGVTALDHAYRQAPDLIISDILMPGLDGFALCRSLKRDVQLRDVPVILLSWKEDLLQRVRELGAGAEGYLRKEASSATIVRRVAEVLRARSEVAARIEAGGPVRGRLDGLTAHSLLAMVCKLRPDACLTVRDALFLYEVEVRSGRPVRATRTSAAGSSTAGPQVIAALLGVGLGRFGVVDAEEQVQPQLSGTLEQQLHQPVAHARAAQLLLSGPALLDVEQVAIDAAHVQAYGDSSPEAARHLLRALSEGLSPHDAIREGRASSQMVETVLGDAARYGAITAVVVGGQDALGPMALRELRIQQGAADEQDASNSLRALVRAATHFDAPNAGEMEGLADHTGDEIEPEPPSAPPEELCVEPAASPASRPHQDGGGEATDGPAPAAPASDEADDATPLLTSQVAMAAAYRRSARTARAVATSVERLQPEEDRPRSAEVVWLDRAAQAHDRSDVAAEQLAAPVSPVARSRELSPEVEPAASFTVVQEPFAPAIVSDPPAPRNPGVAMPSSFAPDSSSRRGKRPRSRFLWPVLFGVAGIGLAVGARWMREQPQELPPPAAPTQQAPAPSEEPSVPPAASPTAAAKTDQVPDHDLPRELELADGDEVGEGEGMLEVVAGKSDEIYVNGKLIGKGPVVKVTLKAVPDPYEVRVKLRGEERVRYAVVKEGKRIKLRVAPPWKR